MENLTIRFLGAARTVTGSRFLVETSASRVLVDCGMFQGRKELRERNWKPFPVDPASLDAVVISHAHLDHVGFLPAVVRDGFSGAVHATRSTGALAGVVLRDAAHIQEADAERANRKGYTKHRPALPLYTQVDAEAALALFRPEEYEDRHEIADGIWLTFRYAGHILGSATVTLELDGGASVCFSGDLGRPRHPILLPPVPPPDVDAIVTESTYGDEEHLEEDGSKQLGEVIAATAAKRGVVVIPAFAVDRTEVILDSLRRLTAAGAIPELPVFVDSPMASSALKLYRTAVIEGHLGTRPDVVGHPEVFDPGGLRITESVDESKAINDVPGPHIIISASGMATGGRVLHHLKRILPGRLNAVILVGYQAPGTRGSTMLSGAKSVRIHGDDIPIRARIASVPAFSVHADRSELLDWVGSAPRPPGRVMVVHGEEETAESFAEAVRSRIDTVVMVPADDETVAVPVRSGA
ncbi:MAG: MBL fold metallo-hydrolase [Acidimicrobiia bacterium]|nr:MBL fold metallo-hydrolase [Acidimicrobiia bacterium]